MTQQLERELATQHVTLTPNDQPCLRIQAKHPAVGNLRVWIEDDEITVGMDLSHTHFDGELCSDTLSDEEMAAEIAGSAADFILAMVSDQVLIEVTYRESVPGSVGMIRLDFPEARGLSPLTKPHDSGVKFYLWSGPLEPCAVDTPVVVEALGEVLFFRSPRAAERYIEPIDLLNGEYSEVFDSAGKPLWLEIITLPQVGIFGTTVAFQAVRLLTVPGREPNSDRLRHRVEEFLDGTAFAKDYPRGAELDQLIGWALRVLGKE